MAGIVRRVLARVARLLTQPLLLAQVAASFSGALAMILAAAAMTPDQFVVYSLINLISVTSVGVVRAGLLQPALIQLRIAPNARTSFAQVTAAAVLATLGSAAATYAIHPLAPDELGWLLLAGIFPILHDWVRFRAMSLDRRWHVLLADGLRLVLVAALSLVVLRTSQDPVLFQMTQGLALAVPALIVSLRLPRVGKVAPLSSYGRAATLQLADFVVGQFNTTVPLLVLGGIATTDTIAGVRFAQTLLGPLNLLFSASTANLITDAATDQSVSNDLDLVTRGTRLARRLGLLSVIVIAGLGGGAWVTGFELRGVGNTSLLQGLTLVGLATVSSGWAGIHAILLRLLGRQGTATAGRTVLVVASLSAYTAGFAIGGVDLSVAAGFATAAVASPLAFVLPASRIYRRLGIPHTAPGLPNSEEVS